MFRRVPDIPVDPQDPFGQDRLNRRESAEILTRLISTAATPLVFAIDAGWGRGKTTFLRMWAAALVGEGFRCVHFNAWESDFSDDPLIPLVGEVRALAKENKSQADGNAKAAAIGRKLTKIGAQIVKRSIPVGVKIATHGLVDLDKAIEDDLSELSEKLATDAIEHYERDKATLRTFRSELAEFAKSVQTAGAAKPLVIFIDELDRCQPLFAIRLLERIKHLFAVPGIVFVLALDKTQLAAAGQAVYGGNFDADGYLGRFFDLEYQFPAAPLEQYVRFLWDTMGFEELVAKRRLHPNSGEAFRGLLSLAAVAFRLSLRDVGQVMGRCALALALGPQGAEPHAGILALLAVLKKGDPKRYDRLIQRKLPVTELLECLSDVVGPAVYQRRVYAAGLAGYVIAALSTPSEYETYVEDARTRGDTSRGTTEQSGYYGHLTSILASVSPPAFFDETVPATVKRLEIAERFRYEAD